MSAVPELRRRGSVFALGRFSAIADRLRYPIAIYMASRVLYLLVALVDIPLRNGHLAAELRNWDGKWYVLLAQHGYAHTLPTTYGPRGWSTLGFEPLYSMLMWFGGAVLPRGVEASGLLISLVSGAVATVEIAVLAERWWGAAASRRAILFYCFFPGTIVFSMVYPEALTLALVAGALLCLEDRRWVLAGLLGGAATAIEPAALAIVPAAAAVSLRELWRRGWRDRGARRSLLAPALSVWGGVGVGIFLWSWTGTPLATFTTQRVAWGEHSSLLSIPYDARTFIVSDLVHWHGIRGVNLNLLVGVAGAFFLLWGFLWLWRLRHGAPVEAPVASVRDGAEAAPVSAAQPGKPAAVPDRAAAAAGTGATGTGTTIGSGMTLGALVWTVIGALLTLTSEQTPPNPRMLILSFPIVLAVAATRTGRSQRILMAITLVMLVAMSIGSFAYGGLRP